MRVVLGVAYRGQAYRGWQSQPDGRTVQDRLEQALGRFVGKPVEPVEAAPAEAPIRTVCAGRTDAGVHALNQVVHFDTAIDRADASWVRGTNRFLPADIAVQWCRRPADPSFHARFSAQGRRYVYLLLASPVRPALEAGSVGWVFQPLDERRLRDAAEALLGEHDFSAFRSAECQAATPVKTLRSIVVSRRGAYWRFEFEANAFLHHMVRNLMGALLAVGHGTRDVTWLREVLASKDRSRAAPTFAADGLYFRGPLYEPGHGMPERTPALDWLPG